ncbi:RNA polymerase sigma factor [Chondrinema litorale]|uniref:RNA polymerase sigma factor n=1 Tax=Chondrinema litorale TaxID=2994555 RepID=UPI002542BFA1|nr:sigma-70 family RNA polymerase sigma factor [Chondrinema litorale]UZR95284.1 sigma-70 family RNA polymerase sigma factor [Chondrinema litorale]
MVDKKQHIIDDKELINGLSRDDYASFECIYNKYYQPLYNYSCQFSGIKAYNHDCIQDLFIDLWNNRSKTTITYSLQAYLYKSLRYKIQHQIRKDQTRAKNIQGYFEDSFEIFFHEQEYLEKIELEKHHISKLKDSIQQLAPKQRELIYLIYFNNLSYDDVSQIMGISKKTAYNQVHSAIKNLRTSLGDLIFTLLFIYPNLP